VNASVEISVLESALNAADGGSASATSVEADLLRFIHLRVHSEYSVSDSIVRIDSLVAAVKADIWLDQVLSSSALTGDSTHLRSGLLCH
jgi:hypothetical protein